MATSNPPNRPLGLAPMEILPPELLTRIFDLCNLHPCTVAWISHLEPSVAYPKHPQIDILTQVCSYWRRVALASPKFWTHIDIVIDHSLSCSLFERTKHYAARASPLPLDIHITDAGLKRDRSDLCDFAFLDADTVPIKSLKLNLKPHRRHLERRYIKIIEYFLAHSQSGIFTEYSIRAQSTSMGRWGFGSFLLPEAMDGEQDTQQGYTIRLSNNYLEQLWLPTRTLRVSGLCPPWSSQAYHGLLDLRLEEHAPRIRATQLVDILKASPELRVLHLKVSVFGNVNGGERVTLKRLEVLYVAVEVCEYAETRALTSGQILDLLSPGSNPLQFGYLRYRGTDKELLQNFVTRSNITFLFVEGSTLFRLPDAVRSVGHLRTLVVDGSRFQGRDAGLLLNKDHFAIDWYPSETTIPQIKTIYISGFLTHYLESLLEAAGRYSVQEVVICGGGLVYKKGSDTVLIPESGKESIVAKLATISSCPSVQYYADNSPLPIDLNDWKSY
ncbi:hypothetical protein ACGC1H_006853 [Rhizoctonia solani]